MNFEYQKLNYASAKRRVVAYVIDFLITSMVIFLIFIPFGVDNVIKLIKGNPISLDITTLIALYRTVFISALFCAAYFIIVPQIFEGQTIGKKIFKIKIVNLDGSRTDGVHLFIREIFGKLILNFGSFFTSHVISFALLKSREDYRAIEDILAGTAVIDISQRRI
ncbi:MAG: RDD family protein [Bacillales bacterium]|jgi:uncharacterized RDD family membrane protein YckC|nr:RDD family protein [Bacillales bacterium]